MLNIVSVDLAISQELPFLYSFRTGCHTFKQLFIRYNNIVLFCRWFQSKAQLVEPIDYESVTVKNKTVLQNDPQRELLLFPHDDVSVSLTRVNRFIKLQTRRSARYCQVAAHNITSDTRVSCLEVYSKLNINYPVVRCFCFPLIINLNLNNYLYFQVAACRQATVI